jgi:hypothetical protein
MRTAGLLLLLLQLLGRADNVKEYIKRDAVEGWVEVTLSGGPGQRDTWVRRTMKKEADNKYSSTYKINGETTALGCCRPPALPPKPSASQGLSPLCPLRCSPRMLCSLALDKRPSLGIA